MASGGTFTVAWDVTAPAGAASGTVGALTATTRWTSGGTGDSVSAGTSLLVGGPVGT